MLLSVDWDAFSGTRELVFDAPIWGTRDREHDRLGAWWKRVLKRGGAGWTALEEDYPLYPGWEALERYAGVSAFVTLSHADAWTWLERNPGQDVLNVDSHHDLASFSGDSRRLRPGNWAGLALEAGLMGCYTCLYPAWHEGLPVAEGYDLARTGAELASLLTPELRGRVTLRRQVSPQDGWPDVGEVTGLLLVQSPAWTSPAHDGVLTGLAAGIGATPIVAPLKRLPPCTERRLSTYNEGHPACPDPRSEETLT